MREVFFGGGFYNLGIRVRGVLRELPEPFCALAWIGLATGKKDAAKLSKEYKK